MTPLPPPPEHPPEPPEGDPTWRHYTKGITPLNPAKPVRKTAKTGNSGKKLPEPQPDTPLPALHMGKTLKSASPALPDTPQKLARQDARKLQKGKMVISAEIDLHGMTQAKAQDALLAFIDSAVRQQFRRVRIITGKGGRNGGAPGALRRAVPLWLKQAPLSLVVTNIHYPPESGGGEGALIVTLKKPRL